MINQVIPEVIFKTRVRDENSNELKIFHTNGKIKLPLIILRVRKIFYFLFQVHLHQLHGSTYQLPDFEALHDEFCKNGIQEILCVSVNDA